MSATLSDLLRAAVAHADQDERARVIAVTTFLTGAVATSLLAAAAIFVPGMWFGVGLIALHVPIVVALTCHELRRADQRKQQPTRIIDTQYAHAS